MKFGTVILVALIFLLVAGCGGQPISWDKGNEIRTKATNACLNGGGVPILDGWTGQVVDCKYPPQSGN